MIDAADDLGWGSLQTKYKRSKTTPEPEDNNT